MMPSIVSHPFNSPVEIGLRALTVLDEIYPQATSLERLIVFDYLLVHSDDVPGGPKGLHPKTPYRSGELLVRRRVLQDGLTLFQTRGLVERHFNEQGITYSASDGSGSFLESLDAPYLLELRNRSRWLVDRFDGESDSDVTLFVNTHLGAWGAEFTHQSVLWIEDGQ